MILRLDIDDRLIAELQDGGLLEIDRSEDESVVREAVMAAIMVVGRLGRVKFGDKHDR